jgi:hypothetical protein
MSSIGPLWLGPTFIVAAAELTLHSARVGQFDLRATAGGSAPAGKVNGRKKSKRTVNKGKFNEGNFKGQECGA